MKRPVPTIAVLSVSLLSSCYIGSITRYQSVKGDDATRGCGYLITCQAEPRYLIVGVWTEAEDSAFYTNNLNGLHCDAPVLVEAIEANFTDTGTPLSVKHSSEHSYVLECPEMAIEQKENDHLAVRVTTTRDGIRSTREFILTRHSRKYLGGGKWLGC